MYNTCSDYASCNYYRPKWVVLSGTKYTYLDYIIMGWQEDDLPLFGRIVDILVVNSDHVLFQVFMAYYNVNCYYLTDGKPF